MIIDHLRNSSELEKALEVGILFRRTFKRKCMASRYIPIFQNLVSWAKRITSLRLAWDIQQDSNSKTNNNHHLFKWWLIGTVLWTVVPNSIIYHPLRWTMAQYLAALTEDLNSAPNTGAGQLTTTFSSGSRGCNVLSCLWGKEAGADKHMAHSLYTQNK